MKFIPVLICLALVLMAPVSFGKTEVHGPAVQATVLDHNEFPCDNCLFGIADYYACFDAGGKILIGHEKVRTQTRKHAPVDLMQRGAGMQISFNDKYIWVLSRRARTFG